jgi:hypothetical protein
MAAFRLGLKQTKWQFNTNYYEFILKLCLIRNREQSPWSTPPILTPTNYSGAPETISNAGFTLSPTLIPLDNLNFNDYPPTGPVRLAVHRRAGFRRRAELSAGARALDLGPDARGLRQSRLRGPPSLAKAAGSRRAVLSAAKGKAAARRPLLLRRGRLNTHH